MKHVDWRRVCVCVKNPTIFMTLLGTGGTVVEMHMFGTRVRFCAFGNYMGWGVSGTWCPFQVSVQGTHILVQTQALVATGNKAGLTTPLHLEVQG